MNTSEAPLPVTNWRAIMRAGIGIIFVAGGCFGAWAAVARLDGGAVAIGFIAVESAKKDIQHLEGGIVSEILVRDGSLVQQSDVLVRLDPTRAQANSRLYLQQLAAALAEEARLVAERNAAPSIELSPEVMNLRSDELVARAIADQDRNFASRRGAIDEQVEITETQIAQIGQEIEAIRIAQETSRAQHVFVSKELKAVRTLYAQQLVPITRVTQTEGSEIELRGSMARADVEIAKANQRIGEARLKIAQLRHEYQQDAAKQLPAVRKLIADLRQQIVVADDLIRRVEVRSPIAGRVQELKVFTIGGVVRPGETLLSVVPDQDRLIIKAQIPPLDAERVRGGMTAEVQFPSFKASMFKLVLGTVRTISSDRLVDEVTREPYFSVEVEIDRSTVPREIAEKLSAGLPATIVIPTGERTVMNYLLAPLSERLFQGMREE